MSMPNIIIKKIIIGYLNTVLSKYADKVNVDIHEDVNEFTINIKVFDSLSNVAGKFTKSMSGILTGKKK